MFAFNQGEVCTSPSRMLVQESIYDKFMEKVVARTKDIKLGNPMDATTMMGAQASNDQYEKILNYIKIGKEEGCKVLTGDAAELAAGQATLDNIAIFPGILVELSTDVIDVAVYRSGFQWCHRTEG